MNSGGSTRFDLIDIIQTLRAKRGMLLTITALAALAGAASYFLTPKRYEASAEVFVSNPQYADRNRIFSTEQTNYIDYFADEKMNDRALVVANSDKTMAEIIFRNGLDKAYKLDTSKRSEKAALFSRFESAYKAKRSEFGALLISFTDKDPQRAAAVANSAVEVIEESFHGYFSGMRSRIVSSLNEKIRSADSTIAVLTDSLAGMRSRSGIYDVLSPNRMNGGISTIRSTDGRAIEEVQNIESLKDQYVADRARYTSLAGEFAVGIGTGDLPVMQVMSPAEVPRKAAGLGGMLTILACAIGGFVFAALWILLSAYYRQLTAATR